MSALIYHQTVAQSMSAIMQPLYELRPVLAAKLEEAFHTIASPVAVDKKRVAYYIPSRSTYCNEAKLFWIEKSSLFMLGSSISKSPEQDREELAKSAQSLPSQLS